MLELNQWFFYQLANFLLLLIFLNFFLFKPFLRLFRERDDRTKGALGKAKALGVERDEILSSIDEKLADARGQARTVFEELSNQGLEVQKSTVQSARNDSVEIDKQARAELEAATDKARNALKSDIEAFSKQIVEKLVKV